MRGWLFLGLGLLCVVLVMHASSCSKKQRVYLLPNVISRSLSWLFKYYSKGIWVNVLGVILFFQGCRCSIPVGIKPVIGFDVHQYLGRWYEIARLDNRFQQGLERVTATYSLQKDASICVKNVGWDSKTNKEKAVVGKAKFVSDRQSGHLKVSFWGPFYASYVIFYLEEDYSVAMVCGNSKQYCWILAREPVLSTERLSKYEKIAQENGFAANSFVYTQSIVPNPAY